MVRGPKKTKKLAPEFSIDKVLNDDNLKKQLEGFIEEAILVQTEIATQKDSLKNIRDEAKDSIGITPRMLMKLVRLKTGQSSLEGAEKELEDLRLLLDALGV